ncbi:MAG TPA: hypothetical protein VMT10_07835 [Solirubrobacteraceae bacterium]|nr:hypothetical protein [Solirubrobacteraceae bacterium]
MLDTYILMITFRVWFLELAVSALNYFVLMKRVYAPRVGELQAHRIGMRTRMAYIVFPFAFVLVVWAHLDSASECLLAGIYWVVLVLAFEWVGSFILRRPVHEILEGWHVERGYLWPYVLLTYLLSPLLAGLVLGRVV